MKLKHKLEYNKYIFSSLAAIIARALNHHRREPVGETMYRRVICAWIFKHAWNIYERIRLPVLGRKRDNFFVGCSVNV